MANPGGIGSDVERYAESPVPKIPSGRYFKANGQLGPAEHVPTAKPGRNCGRCGKRLSIYNAGNRCHACQQGEAEHPY